MGNDIPGTPGGAANRKKKDESGDISPGGRKSKDRTNKGGEGEGDDSGDDGETLKRKHTQPGIFEAFQLKNKEEAWDELKVLFEPGPTGKEKLGMEIDLETGYVHRVSGPPSQAMYKGVKPGMYIRSIDAFPYEWALLKNRLQYKKTDLDNKYLVTFVKPEHKVPRTLHLHSPDGPDGCAGIFELVRQRDERGMKIANSCPEGMRMWLRRKEYEDENDRWLFSSKNGGWNEQKIKVTCTGEASSKGEFTVRVTTKLNSAANDESFGIDNVKLAKAATKK